MPLTVTPSGQTVSATGHGVLAQGQDLPDFLAVMLAVLTQGNDQAGLMDGRLATPAPSVEAVQAAEPRASWSLQTWLSALGALSAPTLEQLGLSGQSLAPEAIGQGATGEAVEPAREELVDLPSDLLQALMAMLAPPGQAPATPPRATLTEEVALGGVGIAAAGQAAESPFDQGAAGAAALAVPEPALASEATTAAEATLALDEPIAPRPDEPVELGTGEPGRRATRPALATTGSPAGGVGATLPHGLPVGEGSDQMQAEALSQVAETGAAAPAEDRRVAGAPTTATATAPPPPETISLTSVPADQQPARLAERLADSIVRQARLVTDSRGTSFHLRLDPPSLGGLDVRVTSAGHGISISVVADRLEGQQAVQAALGHLTRAIGDRGIAVQQVDVSLSSSGFGTASGQQQQAWPGADPRAFRWGPAGAQPSDEPAEERRPPGGPWTIDLRI